MKAPRESPLSAIVVGDVEVGRLCASLFAAIGIEAVVVAWSAALDASPHSRRLRQAGELTMTAMNATSAWELAIRQESGAHRRVYAGHVGPVDGVSGAIRPAEVLVGVELDSYVEIDRYIEVVLSNGRIENHDAIVCASLGRPSGLDRAAAGVVVELVTVAGLELGELVDRAVDRRSVGAAAR